MLKLTSAYITLKELGRLNEALASYNQVDSTKPDYAEATTTWASRSKN